MEALDQLDEHQAAPPPALHLPPDRVKQWEPLVLTGSEGGP